MEDETRPYKAREALTLGRLAVSVGVPQDFDDGFEERSSENVAA